ncbi:hypothetical protein QYF61_006637 [Mycteria americana]|uniref:Uncharacterized protein n=1 Tax=Mycteria americana TaxID=33587 RepID=A0AAN7NPP9_MYCAM|nr:hypothetical protein QYF61_006637 [Mycteria americana]
MKPAAACSGVYGHCTETYCDSHTVHFSEEKAPTLEVIIEVENATVDKERTHMDGKAHSSQKKRLKELGVFSLEKRRPKEDLTTVSCQLTEGYREDGDSLFSEGPTEKTTGNRLKLQQGKFWLDIKKNFILLRGLKQVPREVGEFSPLEMFRTCLNLI